MRAVLQVRMRALCLWIAAAAALLAGVGSASQRVHAFFYLWYGNASHGYRHWDHAVLPHWNEATARQYPVGPGHFAPPERIASPFYPARGCYDSRDAAVLAAQMQDMAYHGIGVAVLSWWRAGSGGDSQHIETDEAVPFVLDAAALHGVKVAFHLEPFPNMTASAVRANIRYIVDEYGGHAAFYRSPRDGLPIFYAYDSYHITPEGWAQILAPDGELTIRRTEYDARVIGLYLNQGDERAIAAGHMDGFYTYFAGPVSHGSRTANWAALAKAASDNSLAFIPCVSAGYDDRVIRPWNHAGVIDRKAGARYEETWEAAVGTSPDFVAITSFNEWGEGTQIEPALSAQELADRGLSGYEAFPHAAAYLEATARWAAYLEATAARDEL